MATLYRDAIHALQRELNYWRSAPRQQLKEGRSDTLYGVITGIRICIRIMRVHEEAYKARQERLKH